MEMGGGFFVSLFEKSLLCGTKVILNGSVKGKGLIVNNCGEWVPYII